MMDRFEAQESLRARSTEREIDNRELLNGVLHMTARERELVSDIAESRRYGAVEQVLKETSQLILCFSTPFANAIATEAHEDELGPEQAAKAACYAMAAIWTLLALDGSCARSMITVMQAACREGIRQVNKEVHQNRSGGE